MNTKKIIATSGSLILSAITAIPVSAHNGDFLTDRWGHPVRDSSGRCVRAVLGNMLPGCGKRITHIPRPVLTPVKPAPVYQPAPPLIEVAPPQKSKPKPAAIKKPTTKAHVLTLNESGGSNFATNSAELSPVAHHQLTAFVKRIQASKVTPSSIIITGHTDSRGSASYNQDLSLKRAQSVALFLATQGLSPLIMHISGKGESQPIASNKTKAGRAANRRVAIRVKGQVTND